MLKFWIFFIVCAMFTNCLKTIDLNDKNYNNYLENHTTNEDLIIIFTKVTCSKCQEILPFFLKNQDKLTTDLKIIFSYFSSFINMFK